MDVKYKEYDPEVLKKLQKTQVMILEDFNKVCEKYDLTYAMYAGTAIGVVRHKGFIPWDDDLDVIMPREDYTKFLSVYKKEIGDKYRILTPLIDPNYTASVTHLQLKGTKFVSEVSKNLKCDLCIDIDIFPLDYLAKDEKERKRQMKRTQFWYRLLFLRGHSKPIINVKGIVGFVYKAICFVVHYILALFRVRADKLYLKAQKESTKYNNQENSGMMVSLESIMPTKAYLTKDELFPIKKMEFEGIYVNMPNKYDDQLRRMYGDYMKVPPKEQRINHCPYLIDFGDY